MNPARWRAVAGLLALLATAAFAADKKAELPTLAGVEEFGRVFLWQDGVKTALTPPWEHNVLGGGRVSADKDPVYELWGWTLEPPRVRFWTLRVALGKPGKPGEFVPLKSFEFARDDFGVAAPDLGWRSDDALALVYGALSPSPRWELWRGGHQVLAKAWDDGRTYGAVSLSPDGQLALAARTAGGRPFLETSTGVVDAPEGVRGRLAAVAWNATGDHPGWSAVGWGAVEGRAPAFLAWWQGQWVTADATVAPEATSSGVLPAFLAVTDSGDLLAAGREASRVTSDVPWVWEPTGPRHPEAPEGWQATAFAASGDVGWHLVGQDGRGQWWLITDQGQNPLEGLQTGDRVTWISPPSAPAKQ